MSNATQEQQKTAVELFQTGDEKIIRSLTLKLGRLLSKKSDLWFHEDTKHLTLQEFQDNFEWDESYSVEAEWETEILNNYDQELECSSKEEALAYVNCEKALEMPDWSDFYPDVVLTGHQTCSLVIEVKNLRLKPQQPKQKTWKLFFEVLADPGFEDDDLDLFCGQVSRFAEQQGGTIKVVATDLAEGDSLTPSWGEVIGQK